MEYTIILGLSVIFALLNNIRAEECVQVPLSWSHSIVKCAADLSPVQVRTAFEGGPVDTDSKCFALCLYSDTGYFKNGEFSTEYIEKFIRNHVFHSLTDKFVALTIEAANEANSVEGDDCDKAYEFFDLNGRGELADLQGEIFCPPDDLEDFEERNW